MTLRTHLATAGFCWGGVQGCMSSNAGELQVASWWCPFGPSLAALEFIREESRAV